MFYEDVCNLGSVGTENLLGLVTVLSGPLEVTVK